MRNWKNRLLSALMIAGATFAFGQGTASQGQHSQHSGPVAETKEQKDQAGALLETVRKATAGFKDVAQAEKAKYSLVFGCVSGSDTGAMGMHFLNSDLLNQVNKTGVFDPSQPQILLYEPNPDGSLRLTGADFIVFADDWNKNHPDGPPQLMGQLFHYFESPNRFGLPAFFTLHVWAWKENPNGAFVNWHPDVTCQSFAGQPL
jgi:hypothetical protein